MLTAAIKLADKGGIEAISMRKLAQKLGVEAMSLYNHVQGKDDILDGIVEKVAHEIDLAPDDSDWKAGMHRRILSAHEVFSRHPWAAGLWMTSQTYGPGRMRFGMRRRILSAHEVFSRHPWAAGLWMTSQTYGPGRMRFAEAILRRLREGGFPSDLIYHGFHVLQSHVMGYTLQESNFQHDADELKELAANFLESFPVEEYPDLTDHIRQHLAPTKAHKDTFAFGLDLILDSLERLRDA